MVKKCNKCGEVKETYDFYKHSSCIGGIRPECKQCSGEKYKIYKTKNIEKIKQKRKEIYYRDREENIRKACEWQKNNKERANRNKSKSALNNIESSRASKRRWAINNHDSLMAIKSRRRSRELNAYPEWLSESHKEEIKGIYRMAKTLSIIYGIKYVVDHKYPLAGKTCSGLHVPWNLQVMTATENNKKSNKMPICEGMKCKI